eukprot:CAMPEP_0201673754 /NCGR_PEP_ID=MMETSP0494-20130426/35450_1 /ASSEMBLY_ACC=CAM_ASM_000839 /TAXON_ID=420259 /ORGANISM="Thalassiosira gravida, Strain GMp14c1" /LENGTH=63 /DNA_ID=CAMNT_0048155743 /DNA_START=364 /DNA_END=555 /DNA_ORIENTATION=-
MIGMRSYLHAGGISNLGQLNIALPAVMLNVANIATFNNANNQQSAASAPNNNGDPKWMCLDPR